MRIRHGWGAVAALWMITGTALGSPLPDGGATAEDVARVLRARGLSPEITVDRAGDPLIRATSDGVKWSINFYECGKVRGGLCGGIEFIVSYDLTSGMTLTQVNAWNSSERFGKVYLDSEYDPYMDMNVDIQFGATTEAIDNDLVRWFLTLKRFKEFVTTGVVPPAVK